MGLLSVGFPTYDDYDGLFFSLQYHRHLLRKHKDVQFVVVDNNPTSEHGKAVKQLCNNSNTKYVANVDSRGTATTKNLVIESSDNDYVVCMDSHVLTFDDAWENNIEAVLERIGSKTLYHANLLLDSMDPTTVYDAMTPDWGSGMLGKWRTRTTPNTEPYDIPMHGMGWFMLRRDSWLGFHKDFVGFGGEEYYIHEKFRQHGGSVKCLPDCYWLHRFNRPNGIPYDVLWEERLYNYYVGFSDLNMPHLWDDALEHYAAHLQPQVYDAVIFKLQSQFGVQV